MLAICRVGCSAHHETRGHGPRRNQYKHVCVWLLLFSCPLLAYAFVVERAQRRHSPHVEKHTQTNQVEEIKGALNKAREAGIQNILALRGDPSKGGFECPQVLRKLRRSMYNDVVCGVFP